MKENTRFYKCESCGNIFGLIEGKAENIICCGNKVEKIKENTDFNEKHTPRYVISDDELIITVPHPMEKTHFIEWIALMTINKTIRVQLYPESDAVVHLPLVKNSKIFAYCNIHGLWSCEVK